MGKLRLAFPHVLHHLRTFRQRRRRKASSSSACEDHANSGISCRGCTSPARVHPAAAAASRSSPSRDHHKAYLVKSSRIRWLHPSSEKARSLNRPALFRKKRARVSSKVIVGQRNRGLLLVCNPCSNSSAGMVTEEYKFKIGGTRRGHGLPTSTTALGREDWEKEKSWNIVTQMGDDLVTKKVVLKKRKKKKTKNRFSCDSCDGATAALAAAQPAAFYEDDRLESSCSSSAGCKYRLSTSSADACCWESGRYAWDREPSFASGDDYCCDEPLGSKRHLPEDCFPMLDRLEASVKEVFVDPACSSRGSMAETSNVEMVNSPLLGDSFQSFEHYIRSLQQLAVEKHFPSPARSARSATWDIDEADDEGQAGGFVDPIVKKKPAVEEKKLITNRCTKLAEASGGISERNVKRSQRKAASRPNVTSSSSSRKSSSKKKSSGPLVGGGVAVVKVSVDPYRDYRDSVVEMIVANGLDQASDVEVEELLGCYLSLNPPEFHDTIINVFSELWFRLVHKQKLN